MPKIVDWDARRDEVLTATWRVIARDGIANTTLRKIALEAGYSHGVLAHYFTNKQDILASALLLCHQRVRERMQQRTAGVSGLAALRTIMIEALPLDAARDLEAGIEISFWHQAMGDPELSRLELDEFDKTWALLRVPLLEAREAGELRSELDVEVAVHALMVLIDGLSVERVLCPSRVNAERELTLLDALLETFRSPGDQRGVEPLSGQDGAETGPEPRA
jgi:AcrR family transcriptional regulator